MNEQEFIELLNLYIDREIGFEDAARLEAEVLSNADRRRIYVQYCRMQKACMSLANESQSAAPSHPSVVDFPQRTSWNSYAAALAAVAACVVTVFFVRDRSLPAYDAPAIHSIVRATAPKSDYMQPVFVTHAWPVSVNLRQDTTSLAAPARLEWLDDVRIAAVRANPTDSFLPVQADFNLDGPRIEDQAFMRDRGDMAAFRFQR